MKWKGLHNEHVILEQLSNSIWSTLHGNLPRWSFNCEPLITVIFCLFVFSFHVFLAHSLLYYLSFSIPVSLIIVIKMMLILRGSFHEAKRSDHSCSLTTHPTRHDKVNSAILQLWLRKFIWRIEIVKMERYFSTLFRSCFARYMFIHIYVHEFASTWGPLFPGEQGKGAIHLWGFPVVFVVA